MSKLHSYPSVLNIGHRLLDKLFDGDVLVQEKIDGSQISFGNIDGELFIRSKGADIYVEAPPKMFANAVVVIKDLFDRNWLKPGAIYRGEFLSKPKHNVLEYGRVPDGHIALFDIEFEGQRYAGPDVVNEYARGLALDVVPTLYYGTIASPEQLKQMLELDSILGGVKIEGVVVKNYSQFGPDHKVLMGKLVSEKFKEVHRKEWGESNPGGKDIIQRLTDMIRTEQRWQKALEHLRDAGLLEQSPRDIGKLVAEVPTDIQTEEEEWIKQQLWNWAWPLIRRGSVKGLAEWYKNKLVEEAFV